jgi:Skp family chaperone for outer membrane proteins
MVLSAAVLFGIGAGAGFGLTQRPAVQAKDAVPPAPARIGYVNIAKVLKGYKKGNVVVQSLQDLRNNYVAQVEQHRAELQRHQQVLNTSTDDQARAEVGKTIADIQKKIQDIDKAAQKDLGARSNDTLVAVHKEITGVVAEVAKDNGLDVVHSYPAATTEAEKEWASLAQMALQAPAVYPLYLNKQLDFTDEILKRLNEKHPPKEGQ